MQRERFNPFVTGGSSISIPSVVPCANKVAPYVYPPPNHREARGMKHARLAAIIGLVALAVAVTSGSAQAAVEDILLEKGQITKEDWLKIKAEKEKETAAPQQASTGSKLLKGVELRATIYFEYTYGTG